jgi:hypothetical protein
MPNPGWNGSTLSFGGGVTPLVDLHQPDEPNDFDTTGSEDTTHTHGTGLHKNSFSAQMLGSKCPIAGTCCAITATIEPGTAKSYGQALITQMTISGRKDSRIEASATFMPGDASLTATTNTWTPAADMGFNGSAFSFNSVPFTGLISASYQSSVTPIESVGGEAGTTDNLYVPGLPDESLSITCLGAPQCAAKAIGATAMSWNDGGAAGTSGDDYTAECVSVRPGGSLDGQTTTEYVFKIRRSA